MGRKNRRRKREPQKGDRASAVAARGRPALVPWRERLRELLSGLRAWARETQPEALEAHLRAVYGEPEVVPPDADLSRAFDDYVCAPGTAGDGRSLVCTFAEESPDLSAEERKELVAWEQERMRRVYLLDRCFRDRAELWDPLADARLLVHLLEKLPGGRVAALRRGAVMVAVTVPWGGKTVALPPLEIYDDDEAVALYRREVRNGGRVWHDLPAPAPKR
ncbi:MAG: hypothetical protein ACYTG6_10620 [Planctomycetota bacterium]|jgi:hypothetical protein